VQNGLVLEPLAVLGTTAFLRRQLGYIFALHRLNAVVACLSGLILVAGGLMQWGTAGPEIALAGSVSLAVPALFSLGVFRRACYVLGCRRYAAGASTLFTLTLFLPAIFAAHRGRLTAAGIWLLMALSAGAAAVTLGLLISAKYGYARKVPSGTPAPYSEIVLAHWNYGKWALAGLAATWVSTLGYVPLLASRGLAQAATYRALDNLYLPQSQLLTAIWLLFLPTIAHQMMTPSPERVSQIARATTLGGLLVSLVYALAVSCFAHPLMGLLYSRAQYDAAAPLAWLIGASVVLRAVSDFGLGLVFRALNRPDYVFYSCLAGAAASVLIGVPLTLHGGVRGAVISRALSGAIQVVVAAVLYRSLVTGLRPAAPAYEFSNLSNT